MFTDPNSVSSPTELEDDRTGLGKEALKRAFLDNLYYVQGKFPALASKHDYYMALAYTVRDRLLRRWISTASSIREYCRDIWRVEPVKIALLSKDRTNADLLQ